MGKKSAARQQIDAILGKSGGKKKAKGCRKIGWYGRSASCVRYRSERRWERNKLRSVRRHLKRLPADAQAREWLAANGGRDDQAFLAKLPVEG